MTQYLRKLVPGKVPEGQYEVLMAGTKITGRGVEALRDHLVYGSKPKDACAKHDCHRGLFTRWLQKLNGLNQVALEICQYYSPEDLSAAQEATNRSSNPSAALG
jgi:hypothetical protein